MKGSKLILVFILLAGLFLPPPIFSHEGRLDNKGGHIDRSTGKYHYHIHPPQASYPEIKAETYASTVSEENDTVTGVGVIIGDTIEIEGGTIIRLIGVATPRNSDVNGLTTQFSNEALAFSRKMVEGKTLTLRYDLRNISNGHKDKNGNILAYVYLADGTLLNKEIIRQGFGYAYLEYPFDTYLTKEFMITQKIARSIQRGIWAATRN